MCGHRRGFVRAERTARADPALRVSDAERDEVAALLRDHAAEGRLTDDELDERLGRALSGRTRGDLDATLADLPRRPLGAGRGPRRPRVTAEITTWAAVSTLLVVIWLACGAGYFWPVWVIGFWGLAVFKHARARGPHWT
jgi:hypothetical protein